jgi:cell division protein FtsN
MTQVIRDYKKSARRSSNGLHLKELLLGAAVGVVISSAAFILMRQDVAEPEIDAKPEPKPVNETETSLAASAELAEQYDFYEMLPKFEVVVPEKDKDVKRDLPATVIKKPGIYVLQAGSYRNLLDAERVRDQLKVQGIAAKVQRVAVDNDVWHRVRIGPSSKLDDINRLRTELQAMDIEGLVIRVGE